MHGILRNSAQAAVNLSTATENGMAALPCEMQN